MCVYFRSLNLIFVINPISYTTTAATIFFHFFSAAKVTFFLQGLQLTPTMDPGGERMTMMKRAYAEGHQIANHGYSHIPVESVWPAVQSGCAANVLFCSNGTKRAFLVALVFGNGASVI
jgi:hypothetical protein